MKLSQILIATAFTSLTFATPIYADPASETQDSTQDIEIPQPAPTPDGICNFDPICFFERT